MVSSSHCWEESHGRVRGAAVATWFSTATLPPISSRSPEPHCRCRLRRPAGDGIQQPRGQGPRVQGTAPHPIRPKQINCSSDLIFLSIFWFCIVNLVTKFYVLSEYLALLVSFHSKFLLFSFLSCSLIKPNITRKFLSVTSFLNQSICMSSCHFRYFFLLLMPLAVVVFVTKAWLAYHSYTISYDLSSTVWSNVDVTSC